jgi:hypothetical protein
MTIVLFYYLGLNVVVFFLDKLILFAYGTAALELVYSKKSNNGSVVVVSFFKRKLFIS